MQCEFTEHRRGLITTSIIDTRHCTIWPNDAGWSTECWLHASPHFTNDTRSGRFWRKTLLTAKSIARDWVENGKLPEVKS